MFNLKTVSVGNSSSIQLREQVSARNIGDNASQLFGFMRYLKCLEFLIDTCFDVRISCKTGHFFGLMGIELVWLLISNSILFDFDHMFHAMSAGTIPKIVPTALKNIHLFPIH